MGLDIRLPIGLMFCILGPILLISGLVNNEGLGTRTGGAMLAFGAFMLIFGVRGQLRAGRTGNT